MGSVDVSIEKLSEGSSEVEGRVTSVVLRVSVVCGSGELGVSVEISSCSEATRVPRTSGEFEGVVDDVRILINIPLVNGLVDNVGASVVVVVSDDIRIFIIDLSEFSS